MMFLIVVLCVAAVFIFFKTYKKEMREKALREAEERPAMDAPAAAAKADRTENA